MAEVLVVEDEDQIREMLVEVLDGAGFKAMEAATADHAACLIEEMCLRLRRHRSVKRCLFE